MIDLTPYLTVVGLAQIVLLIMQTVKQFINIKYVGYIPYGAVIVAFILATVAAYGLGKLTTSNEIAQVFFVGLLAGAGAIGEYEMTLNKLSVGPK